MKSLFNRLNLNYALWILLVAMIVKAGWFVVETGWLSFSDTDYVAKATKKPLFYTSHFASAAPPAIQHPTVSKPRQNNEIRQMKLLSIYHSRDNDVATVLYKRKTKVIARGEKIGGYTLQSGGIDFAIFERNGKTYTLYIQKDKSKSAIFKHIQQLQENSNGDSSAATDDEVITDGNRRIVSRATIHRYTKDMKSIFRNIGINEIRKKGKIEGFKVTFVRRNSIFAKLGLRRGDVLEAINGQPLDSLKAAFDAYRNVNSEEITDLTLEIKRGDQTMELQYEID